MRSEVGLLNRGRSIEENEGGEQQAELLVFDLLCCCKSGRCGA